jgi:VWFA-related protein
MLQRHPRFLLCLAIFFLTTGSLRSAQESQTAPPAQPVANPSPQQSSAAPARKDDSTRVVYESATVLRAVTRLVVVDVVATDDEGKVVTDLKKEDFSISENNKQQQITAFSFQHPLPPGTAPVHEVKVNLQPNIFTNVPSYRPDGALNVLLLDGLNTNFANQAYARQQMLKYLDKIPEGRPIAVYMLSSKLRMLQDFTSDPEVLRKVVKNLKGEISPVLDNPAGGQEIELLPPGMADSGLVSQDVLTAMQEFENERVAFQTDIRVRYTLDAMNSLARMLSGYPGRKNLIWVSEAFPINLDPDFTLSVGSFDSMRNYAAQIAETSEHMVDAQIAVYPIDARGLVGSSYFDASSSGNDKFGRSLGRGGRLGQAISQESSQLQAVHGTMQDLAQRTGGKAFYNRNDLDSAIRSSIEDGSTYYTLAYYPENKNWDGKFRKIHVKVARDHVKLRYRVGYFAADPRAINKHDQKHEAAAFGQALSLDYPISTALRFHAGVVQPSEKTKNKVLVNFGIDPHAITFEKQDDGLQHASLDCAVQVYTDKGKLLKTQASTVNAQLKPETFARVMETIFPCQQYLDLEPGNYLLRLGVLDHASSLIGTTNARVTIDAPNPSASN